MSPQPLLIHQPTHTRLHPVLLISLSILSLFIVITTAPAAGIETPAAQIKQATQLKQAKQLNQTVDTTAKTQEMTTQRVTGKNAITEECQRIGNKLGSVSTQSCLNSQLADTGARSVKGQAILMKEYPPLLERRKPIGRVLIIGGTHGDEYASVSIVFKWMQILDVHHSGMFHWHVAPLINPDGLLLSRPSVRLNANGVDLNRNMPTPDWYWKTARYWKNRAFDPRRYPGTAPLSEPESRWLYEEIRRFKPHAIVSVHAPYGVLDFDGPPVGPKKIGQLHLRLIGVYPGSLGNSAGVQHEIPVITVELPYAGIMPSKQQTSKMWTDLIHWLRFNIPKKETLKAHAMFDEISHKLMASPTLPEDKRIKANGSAASPTNSSPAKNTVSHPKKVRPVQQAPHSKVRVNNRVLN